MRVHHGPRRRAPQRVASNTVKRKIYIIVLLLHLLLGRQKGGARSRQADAHKVHNWG